MARIIALMLSIIVVTGCSDNPVATHAPLPTNQQAVAMPDTFSADAAMAVLQEG